MRWRKFLIFCVSIFGLAVVVFNNLKELAIKMLVPYDRNLIISFAIITIGIIGYVLVNPELLGMKRR